MEKYLDKNGVLRLLQGVKTQINKSKETILNSKGIANGIASLDGNGFVPLAQLGNLDTTFFEIVEILPDDVNKIKKHIYIMKESKNGENNKYAEYIYTGDLTDGEDALVAIYDETKWEKLGDFVPDFDLKEYSKKEETLKSIDVATKQNSTELYLQTTTADGKILNTAIPTVVSNIAVGRTIDFSPGTNGLMSVADKYKLDQIDLDALTASINNANTAASNTNTAITKAEQAAAGAERCNVTMKGSTITVTDRNGSQSSIDVIDTDEVVTVKIASSVEGISIKGQKINVFLNHDTKTPQQYMTDETGTATFSVHRGEYYEVNFTVYANAQPIAPVGYTAVRADREIAVEYMPYDEETSEKVIATVTKYIEGKGSPWEGKTVQCTYDKKTTEYQTDAKGQAVILVPVGKEYTINVDNEDGYYVKFSNNKRTYTAKVPQRMLAFNMYQFKTGLYCVDANLNEYTIDEWVATGRDAEEVVAIKVADQNLMLNRGTFMMRTSDLRNTSALITRQWCTQNVLFESIATNGNNSNDANYWNGEQSTFLIRQEAQERSLSVPAADYAYNQIFTIGEQDLHGFMMSVGQEYVHISNFGLIREMLRTLYGDDVAEAYYKFMSNTSRWTSTQGSSTNAWIFNSSASNYSYVYKTNSYRVLPVFAC